MHAPNDARLRVRQLLALTEPEAYRPTSVERQRLRTNTGIAWEAVTLATADGDDITCFLLSPEEPNGPTVIALHQHAAVFTVGKSEVAGFEGEPAVAYGIRLAEQGARVLIPDLLGFEDRRRNWSADDAADERLDALLRIAEGGSLQAKHTRDLATLTTWIAETFGDDGGIGVMGHSLGGQVALFALAVDARLTRGVISCGLGTLASFREHAVQHNPAWFVPGLTAAGDVPLLANALERQQVFVSVGSRDPLFPMGGVREVLDGFAADVSTVELFDGGHELPGTVLEHALDFLVSGRWRT
jgi:dienelactone hydrolase